MTELHFFGGMNNSFNNWLTLNQKSICGSHNDWPNQNTFTAYFNTDCVNATGFA